MDRWMDRKMKGQDDTCKQRQKGKDEKMRMQEKERRRKQSIFFLGWGGVGELSLTQLSTEKKDKIDKGRTKKKLNVQEKQSIVRAKFRKPQLNFTDK